MLKLWGASVSQYFFQDLSWAWKYIVIFYKDNFTFTLRPNSEICVYLYPPLPPDRLGRANTLPTSPRQGTAALQVLSTTDTDIFPFSFPTHSSIKSGLAALWLQSPCSGMNCLKTTQTQHRSPLLCSPSHHGQAGHFYWVPTTSEILDSAGRAAATFQDVSTPLWCHLQTWVTLMTWAVEAEAMHQCSCCWPTPGPGKAPPHPQGASKTVKQPRQADKAPFSLTFTIWDYYPLGNINIPFWKKHHLFKNYLHRAI